MRHNQDLIADYITRGGRKLTIKLPLDEFGEVLADKHLSSSERRKLFALQLRTELGERETMFITIH